MVRCKENRSISKNCQIGSEIHLTRNLLCRKDYDYVGLEFKFLIHECSTEQAELDGRFGDFCRRDAMRIVPSTSDMRQPSRQHRNRSFLETTDNQS